MGNKHPPASHSKWTIQPGIGEDTIYASFNSCLYLE